MAAFRVYSRLIPFLFAVAAFSLVWRIGVAGVPKPFEVLILLVFLLAAADAATQREAQKILRRLAGQFRTSAMLLLGFLAFTLVGIAASAMRFSAWQDYLGEVVLEYGRMLFVFLLFFLAVYVVYRYRESALWVLGAIAFSPVVLFAAFAPQWREFFTVASRLVGARNDPNYLATFLALGLLSASVYFLFTSSRARWLGIGYIALASPLFLWAYSRAAYLAIAIALVVLAALSLFRERSAKSIGAVALLGVAFAFFTGISFFLLPAQTQFLIYRRSIAPVFDSEELRVFMADTIAGGDSALRSAVLREIPSDTFDISRGRLWSDALYKAARNPLGFGPAYHNWNPVGGGEEPRRPHNLFFEIILTAGWGGFLVLSAFIVGVAKKAWLLLRSGGRVGSALGISFYYLLVNSIFLDTLTLRWLWLVMGLIVGYALLREDEKANRIGSSADL